MMQTSRPPNGSPGLRMYQQQVPIPSIFLQNSILISILYIYFILVNTNNQGGLYGSPVASSLSSSFNGMFD
jgi:hypothetical protein